MNLFTYYWIGVNYIDDELKTIFGWLLDILQCTKERRIDMTELETFLESSSISGLNHISATRRYGRLFWVFVVLTGFTLSGFLIYESFQAWEESPVKTTIETLSITANLGDSRTIVTHPASTTHSKLSDDERKEARIHPGMIRVSCGLESIIDILADIEQALNASK